MGGFGSGRPGYRGVVEDGLTLDGYQLLSVAMRQIRQGAVSYVGNVKWDSSESIGVSVTEQCCTLSYQRAGAPVDCAVPVTDTPQPKGGRRHWFRCPLCRRRCAKLYHPRHGFAFACRACYGLTYRSCNDSHKWDCLLRRLGIQAGHRVANRPDLRGWDSRRTEGRR